MNLVELDFQGKRHMSCVCGNISTRFSRRFKCIMVALLCCKNWECPSWDDESLLYPLLSPYDQSDNRFRVLQTEKKQLSAEARKYHRAAFAGSSVLLIILNPSRHASALRHRTRVRSWAICRFLPQLSYAVYLSNRESSVSCTR